MRWGEASPQMISQDTTGEEKVQVTQSGPTIRTPMDCTVHEFSARILE